MRSLAPLELHARLGEGGPPMVMLDVREPWEFEICHLDSARNVPMDGVESALSGLDRHAEIVVMCHYGIRSRDIALRLEGAGFARVINLEGGLDAWAREVDPEMPTY